MATMGMAATLATRARPKPRPKPETELDRYLASARAAGCPRDQLAAFIKAGYVAQPKQLPFHAAARLADDPAAMPGATPAIAQGGARGGAKSHGALCQVVHDDCHRYPGLKWLFLRAVGASARESFEDMLSKALRHLMEYYKGHRGRLELPNGSTVILGGFRTDRDIEKYLGLEYDGILVDDAHLISADRHNKILGSLRTSKPGWRPRCYVTFNPGGIGHAYLKKTFVEPWRAGRETDTRFFFSLPEDNKFLNPEYIQYLEGLTGWLYRAWRKGDFDVAAGQFFTTFSSDVHVVNSDAMPAPASWWTYWLSMDYGFTHWNVVHLFGESPDGTVYTLDEHAERRWLPERHAEAVRAMLARHNVDPAELYVFVAGADVFAARPGEQGSIADQWQAAGFTLTPAVMDRINGAGEVLKRLGDVDAGISPTWYIHERCGRLIECLPSLEHDPHRPEDVLKIDTDEDGAGGDDAYDSARYGLMVRALPAGAVVTAGVNPLAGWRG